MFYQPDIILPPTLLLLQKIMDDKNLDQFYLVGGTALALQIGHRFSIDLDLFSSNEFDNNKLQSYLENNYEFETDYIANNTLKGAVNQIKCDFITHHYPLIEPIMVNDKIRLASLKDIAAMKLNAIAHNGTRYKDFIDIYFLLSFFTLNELLGFYTAKYPKSNPVIAIKGLGYFEDINFEFDKPVVLKAISFSDVKQKILQSLTHPNQLLQ
jgi:hypothetical protein